MTDFPFFIFLFAMIAVLRKRAVYKLFQEYFGEDKVDMQGNYIIVWWPELVVSNEKEQSCTIKNLYARVYVENNGTLSGYFTLIRSEYTYDQWVSGYCHSHVSIFDKTEGSLKLWREPCLGQGPIRETISNLQVNFDEDVWRLFIFELDQYVRHESLEGIPYTYLSKIGTDPFYSPTILTVDAAYTPDYLKAINNEIVETMVRGVVKLIIEREIFKFNFINGCYGIADSPMDIVIKVSNIFIDWYNNLPTKEEQDRVLNLFREYQYFIKCKVINNTLQRCVDDRTDYNLNLQGIEILTFKGERQLLKITAKDGGEEFEENCIQVLQPRIVMAIIHKILRTINYRFNGADEERASRTREAVRYI